MNLPATRLADVAEHSTSMFQALPSHVVSVVATRRRRRYRGCAMQEAQSQRAPEQLALYEKSPANKSATITLNRAGFLDAPTIAARERYAELRLRANINDDVKVLSLRGVGENH